MKINLVIQSYIDLINQLVIHLNRIPLDAYSEKLSSFDGATIGEHVRHIYNFPECLLNGVQTGKINYDKRIRDAKLEVKRDYAVFSLLEQCNYILNLEHYEDMPILLETTFGERMTTNLKRELHYIIEHTTHHMAILRFGIKINFPDLEIDDSFGYAKSTLEYKELQMNK